VDGGIVGFLRLRAAGVLNTCLHGQVA